MNKSNLPRLAAIAVAALVAALMCPSVGYAQLPDPRPPVIQFDSRGETHYDFTQQLLSIDASALGILLPGAPPASIQAATGTAGSPGCNPPSDCGTLTIRARVNNSGFLVGGVAGPHLTIVGKVLDPFSGTTIADGVLLTGDVKEFFVGAGKFEIRFSITGGLLMDFGFFNQCGEWGTSLCDLGTSVGIALPAGSLLTPFTGSFASNFDGGAAGAAGAIDPVAALPPAPPVVSGTGVIVEAVGPTGAPVTLSVTATDFRGQGLSVSCSPASGTVFGLGRTDVLCTSAPDSFSQAGSLSLVVIVQDTTRPDIIGIGNLEVEVASGESGTNVFFEPTATDLVDVRVPAECTPPSGSFFSKLNPTLVTCTATDSHGNMARGEFYVTVKVKPAELPGGSCFVVDFREITYFRNQNVITSTNAPSGLNPALWPYRATGGAGYTKSRATLPRIYGFLPSEYEYHHAIPNADNPAITYPVRYDSAVKGYYIDLNGPARVMICPNQLHNYVLGKKGNGHIDKSALLPLLQRNVPGIMLTHNTQIVKLPSRVRKELYQLGLYQAPRGVIDYIGFQLQGNGNAEFHEFVDVEVQFPGDSQTDRLQHYGFGFHTAINTNFESFAGCNYVDYAPGNDAVRLRDLWGPNRSKQQGYANWRACGAREPAVNQRQRANYDVPFNAVQLLPTVNSSTDTLRLFYGTIRPIPESEMKKKDQKTDWAEWDRWDY